MDRGGLVAVVIAVALAVAVLFVLFGPSSGPPANVGENCSTYPAPYEVDRSGETYNRTTVALYGANGTQLATVDVRIADTAEKLRTGLSETESLPDGEGMLFVHEEPGEYGYWMRGMAFPLDIVFVGKNGTITTIHHAPTPEQMGGDYGNFPGWGLYVLEVPRGWTNATGVGVGDCVAIPDGVTG